jgi:protein SCO1/2
MAETAAAAPLAGRPLPDSSLYQLDATWRRDDGQAMKLADLGGKVRVLSLFYTGCENLCPMIMGQLKSLEAALPAPLRDSVGFVLATLDPKADSPSALRKYRKASHLDADRWTLFRGNADDTRELAALLGVRYTPKDDEGQMAHNGMIAILDRSGSVLLRAPGIEDRPAFIEALRRAVAGRP